MKISLEFGGVLCSFAVVDKLDEERVEEET